MAATVEQPLAAVEEDIRAIREEPASILDPSKLEGYIAVRSGFAKVQATLVDMDQRNEERHDALLRAVSELITEQFAQLRGGKS